MSATTTKTFHFIDCPACGKPIELHATYDVHLDQSTDVSATEKVVTAKVTMAGARIQHNCQPTATRGIRED